MKSKKSRRKKLILWLCIDLVVAGAVISLLLYTPSQYHPATPPADDDPNGRRVHPYVTHELMPTLYNNAQDRKPFEMEVLDTGLNEAFAQMRWTQESGGIKLSSPAIAFTRGRIMLMGAADIEGADLIVTVEIDPKTLEDGRLNLVVENVKIGVLPITWPAKRMARKMYREQVEAGGVDMQDWRTKIVASLLNEEPFEPVFPVDDRWVRVTGIDVAEGKLTVRLAPAK
ncbi:MAG TPA: hypothetical protein VLI39_04785 [Sedimentisphaerales bacterium]|nr:hypothetical protein [Sedimentisphaerales bacterium]